MRRAIVNGVFDVIHRGHVELLQFARSASDILIVAIDSDDRVRKNKGPSRPINTHEDRKFLLRGLRYVDDVVIFDNDDDLIKLVKQFDVVIKGSDYKDKDFFEKEHCKQIIYYDKTKHSTTKTIQSLIDR